MSETAVPLIQAGRFLDTETIESRPQNLRLCANAQREKVIVSRVSFQLRFGCKLLDKVELKKGVAP
jgi:hypothetical protein